MLAKRHLGARLYNTYSGIPWISGAYVNHDATKEAAFATFRGASLDMVTVYPARENGWTSLMNTWWASARLPSARLEVCVPLWPSDGSVVAAASGAYNSQWAQFTNLLMDGDVLRVGWEMNLPSNIWYWSVNGTNLSDWRQAWTQMYNTVKATNPNVLVSWVANIGDDQSGVDVTTAYVDGEADVIGVDAFDNRPAVFDEAAWIDYRDRPSSVRGLTEWLNFAKSNGYHLRLVGGVSQDAGGANDNPLFVERMLERLYENRKDTAYEVYFSESTTSIRSDLGQGSNNPLGPARYKVSIAACHR